MNFDLKRIISLKRGPSKKLGLAPHKPVLLLAVIEQFEIGELTNNWIEITPELITSFQDIWNIFVDTGHSPTFALPFYHLSNEPENLWRLQTLPGKEIPLTKSHSIKSLRALTNTVAAAQLDPNLYLALLNPKQREEIKNIIINHYFSQNHYSVKTQKRYSTIVEKEILCDPSENYARKIKRKLKEIDKDLIEQEIIVRSSVFKKAIVQIYQHKCAISGLDIKFSKPISLVDACHIIPFAESYDDTITNGIALSPTFHRAFDRGLISISDNYKVILHPNVKDRSKIHGFKEFNNCNIFLPENLNYYPNLEKLALHRKRFGF